MTANRLAMARNGHSPAETPPHDLDAERGVLASILVDNSAALRVCDTLRASHFFHSGHGEIYEAIIESLIDGIPVDRLTIADRLKGRGKLDDIGGVEYLKQLSEREYHSLHAPRYAAIVTEQWKRREIASRARSLYRMAHDSTVPTEDLAAHLDWVHEQIQPPMPDRFRGITAAQLNELSTATEDLVDSILIRGQPCILAGGKKMLKTNIAIDLTLSLALGVRFLGEFTVPKGVRVALLSGESGPATIQETARRIAISKGYPLANFGNAIFGFELPTFGDADDMAGLERFIASNKIEVLLVDPVYLCLPIGDAASNLFMVGAMLKELTEVIQRTGATLVLLHHTRKGSIDPFAPPELEDIAWAGFQEFARQWLLIGRRERYDPENGGDHKLWLNVGGSAGHSGLWAIDIEEGTRQDCGGRRWDLQVIRASEARREARSAEDERRAEMKSQRQAATRTEHRQRVLKALEMFPGGETQTVIRETAGMNSRHLAPVLAELLAEGVIERCELMKSKKKIDGLRIRRDVPGTAGNDEAGTVPVTG